MTNDGFSTLVEGLKKNCLAPEQLKLKVGAEVMFVKNDLAGGYVNGTRSVVVGFDKNSSEGWPIVKTYDNKTLVASPAEWKYEEEGVVRAIITQVPLRLAWAITIHKSQGMTLDAAEIDLGDAFEPGMGYVALSRVRNLNGLKLMNLNEMALKVHPKILQQDKTFKDSSAVVVKYLQTLSEKEKLAYHRKTLIERFGGYQSPKSISQKKVNTRKKKVPTHMITLEMLKESTSLKSIAEKRGFSVGTIISHMEKLKGLKQIDNSYLSPLKDLPPKEDFDVIFSELKQSEDGKLLPVYDKFKGKYSYASIRVVRLFML